LATESFPIIKMHKSFVIILLSWAVAVYSSDLEAVVVGVLPSGREDTVAAFDGDNSMYIMGGYDGMNLFHEIYQFNLSQHGAIHEIAYFPVGITEGTLGKDGKGAFYYIGGDVGGRSRDIWRMTPENMTPEVVGQLPEPNRLSCSASDGMGNIYIVGGAEGNMEVRRNIVKYDTTLNVQLWLPSQLDFTEPHAHGSTVQSTSLAESTLTLPTTWTSWNTPRLPE